MMGVGYTHIGKPFPDKVKTHTIKVEDVYSPKAVNSKEVKTREIITRAYEMAAEFLRRHKRAMSVSDIDVTQFPHKDSRVFVGLRATLTITYDDAAQPAPAPALAEGGGE